MIRLIDVKKVYDNGTEALKGISFSIEDGEFAFLVGPSGSGKSTVIKLLTGEIVPTSGRVMVNGFSMGRISDKQIPYMRRTIGVIFQDFRLITNKTVWDNLSLAMRAVGASPREIKARIPYVLELVGLKGKEQSLPDQLSGGEQQRVAIARALVNNPSTIVADEPTGNLDPARSLEIMTLLERINALGTTVVVVTHEKGLVNHFDKRVITINAGMVAGDAMGRVRGGQMKGNFRYFFREGSRNMFSHGFMSFAAIGITVACLLIMGTFSLVAYNADYNLKNLQKENAVLAFIDESLTEDQARALQGKVEAVPNVADATFVSREQARDSYVAQYDENDLYADLDPSIFRHRFVVHLQDETQLSQTVEALRGVEHIAKVRADEAVSAGFITARNVAGVISIALIAILLVVSVFIISNTIKLTTFDRRDEIAIMKMVGATDGFIRWPFVFEGLLLGLFGAVIAFFLQWLLYNAIASGIAGSDSLQILRVVSFQKIGWPVGGVFLLAGILVGVGGSLTAIRKFLRV